MSLAQITILNEIEPNDVKDQAQAVTMGPGTAIVGSSTGGQTSIPGIFSADYYLVTTLPAPPGIYRHRLILNSSILQQTGAIRGLTQSNGVIQTTDVAVQTSWTGSSPAYMNQWYGFGKSEQIYYRVNGRTTTLAPYQVQYDTSEVIPVDLGNFQPGQLTITSVGMGHNTDTDMWIYDAQFNAMPGFGNDDEGPNRPNLGSRIVRTFAPGRYYLALSPFNLANNLASDAADEDYRNGNVLDFPNVLAGSSWANALNISFKVIDANGTHNFPTTSGGPYDIHFATFYVGTPPAPCPADYNHDGDLNSNDLSDVLSQWFSDLVNGTLFTDFDHDGEVSSNDVSWFLNQWFVGC